MFPGIQVLWFKREIWCTFLIIEKTVIKLISYLSISLCCVLNHNQAIVSLYLVLRIIILINGYYSSYSLIYLHAPLSAAVFVSFSIAAGSAPLRQRSILILPSGGGKGSRKAEADKAVQQTRDLLTINRESGGPASFRDVGRLGGRSIIIRTETVWRNLTWA